VELLPPSPATKDFGGAGFADEEGVCVTGEGADEPDNSASQSNAI